MPKAKMTRQQVIDRVHALMEQSELPMEDAELTLAHLFFEASCMRAAFDTKVSLDEVRVNMRANFEAFLSHTPEVQAWFK